MAASVRLVLFAPVVREVADDLGGKFVADTADAVAEHARRMVPTRTGRLLASIDAQTRVEGFRIIGTVSADTPYATYVHEGTQSHDIFPIPPTEALNLGPDGFAESVHHPGTQAVPYLTEPLRRVCIPRGFIVT